MSLTCLTCSTVFDPPPGTSAGACPRCGEDLVGVEGAWIEWDGPPGQGCALPFDGMTVGRLARCDLVIKDREISKVHASFHRQGTAWVIRDAGSANGTLVNDQVVVERRLKDGDRVLLGGTELRFHESAAPPGSGGVTIVPQPVGAQTIQACLKCEPGDFKPAEEIADHSELQADYSRLLMAYQFHRYMASERDPHALLGNILQLAFDLLPADRGAILLREDEGAPLSPAVSRNRAGDPDGVVIPDSILRRAVKERSAVLSADALVDLRFQASVSVIDSQVRSAMCVPLVGDREVLGAIHLDTREQTGAFSVKDLQLLSVLAGQAAVLLERARLNQRLDRESQARERLTRFLSPEVLREVVERGMDLDAEGRTGRVSVLFCDIRGFTALAESMEPKQLVRMLNGFFERMVDVIFQHGGVLDKFIGDALMAVWGAPIERPNDARRAVEAGLAMIDALGAFGALGRERGWPELKIGIGINTGEVVIGTVGSSRRMEYTVMGDAVNLAARVCDLAQGGQMLVTSATLDACGAGGSKPPRVKRLPPAQVRGRKKAVQVFEVLGA
jgi:adenylate cyclase